VRHVLLRLEVRAARTNLRTARPRQRSAPLQQGI
jgi:hypothetical protein